MQVERWWICALGVGTLMVSEIALSRRFTPSFTTRLLFHRSISRDHIGCHLPLTTHTELVSSASIPPWQLLRDILAAWPLTTETSQGCLTVVSKIVTANQGKQTGCG